MKINVLTVVLFFAENSPSPSLLLPDTVLNIQDEPIDLSVRSRKRRREEENPGSDNMNKISVDIARGIPILKVET